MSVGLGLPGDILAVSLEFLHYDSQEDVKLCPMPTCFCFFSFSLL